MWYFTNGFQKKTKKTPGQEIRLAEERKRDYLEKQMSDLQKYIKERKKRDPEFVDNYEEGYKSRERKPDLPRRKLPKSLIQKNRQSPELKIMLKILDFQP